MAHEVGPTPSGMSYYPAEPTLGCTESCYAERSRHVRPCHMERPGGSKLSCVSFCGDTSNSTDTYRDLEAHLAKEWARLGSRFGSGPPGGAGRLNPGAHVVGRFRDGGTQCCSPSSTRPPSPCSTCADEIDWPYTEYDSHFTWLQANFEGHLPHTTSVCTNLLCSAGFGPSAGRKQCRECGATSYHPCTTSQSYVGLPGFGSSNGVACFRCGPWTRAPADFPSGEGTSCFACADRCSICTVGCCTSCTRPTQRPPVLSSPRSLARHLEEHYGVDEDRAADFQVLEE